MDNVLKKPWAWIILIGAVVAGIILYSGGVEFKKNEEDVALKVNETTFTHVQFNELLSLVRENSDDYGASTDEEIKNEAINVAVQQALLLEHADEIGLGATKEEIDLKVEQFMTENEIEEEDLFGITGATRKELEDYFEMDIKVNNLFNYYAEGVVVTDEEIDEAYALYSLQSNVPALEEIKEDIRRILIENKVTSVLLSKVEELKEDAKIEIFF